ncbi:hypothetical protein CFC21_045055 [Triticum aestivum]|uniref:KIB1-4 beta-propeller domain-containing protein n=2 Tax=Triticum aestivum TaxID=4565 RepID=A0A9R1FS55_WHEAT|nr:hypothetical protein CFC21_045055 [Triticum aestivum]
MEMTSAKNLVFCDGHLYQIWRNATSTVTLQLQGGGRRRVAQDEIFALRYDPRCQPCWDVVANLVGYSVFVGMKNSVSLYAEGVSRLKGNCVHWIGGRGRDEGMVFDMRTRRSTPCLRPVDGVIPESPHGAVCCHGLNLSTNMFITMILREPPGLVCLNARHLFHHSGAPLLVLLRLCKACWFVGREEAHVTVCRINLVGRIEEIVKGGGVDGVSGGDRATLLDLHGRVVADLPGHEPTRSGSGRACKKLGQSCRAPSQLDIAGEP